MFGLEKNLYITPQKLYLPKVKFHKNLSPNRNYIDTGPTIFKYTILEIFKNVFHPQVY